MPNTGSGTFTNDSLLKVTRQKFFCISEVVGPPCVPSTHLLSPCFSVFISPIHLSSVSLPISHPLSPCLLSSYLLSFCLLSPCLSPVYLSSISMSPISLSPFLPFDCLPACLLSTCLLYPKSRHAQYK